MGATTCPVTQLLLLGVWWYASLSTVFVLFVSRLFGVFICKAEMVEIRGVQVEGCWQF
jgi:hypothetical protein